MKSERVGVFARFALLSTIGAPRRLGEAEGLLTDMRREMGWARTREGEGNKWAALTVRGG